MRISQAQKYGISSLNALYKSLFATAICALTTSHTAAIPPTQTIKLTASDGLANDQFGNAVALSNLAGFAGVEPDIAIVGLRYDDIGAAADRGSANIYKLNSSGNWIFEAKLTASDGAAGDAFGYSVAIFGNTAIVGAPFDDITLLDQGSAYIFQRSTAGVWTQVVKTVPVDPSASDAFGYSVAITNTAVATANFGDLVIVGSPNDDIGLIENQGSAYVFKRATSGIWAQESKFVITGSDAAAEEDFGWSVSIYGDRALVSAPFDDISSVLNRGSAYTFKRSTAGVWTLEAKLVPSDGATNDFFGYSLCLFNNQIIASSPYDDIASAADRGSAYIFQLSGTSTWTQEAKIVGSDGVASDFFGAAVALQGNLAIATSPNDDATAQGGSTTFNNIGSAYLFTQTGTSTWTQEARFTGSDGLADKFFGISANIYGERAIIGANGDDIGTPLKTDQGSAYIFHLKPIDCNNNGIPDAEDISSGIAQDCNLNAIPDSCDIATGFAQDCNANGVPDSCDISTGFAQDCNANGVPDSCDIATGFAKDCNANAIPDSCDIATGFAKDCNANAIPDSCDIATGLVQDCNLNGIPDLCDIATGLAQDCNTNAIPDSCDIGSGFAQDCNANTIPDSCDIATGLAQDCNLNGIPDSCDIATGFAKDCNTNAIPDSCDIATGLAQDCNLNGIPDLCDIATGFAKDCNANAIPDSCDIATGFAKDCNANTIPDSCDIATGLAQDCNANTIPDSCDIATGLAQDCNLNGIPDSCDIGSGFAQDCNLNGIPDLCDIASGFSNDIDTNSVPDECKADCNQNEIPDAYEIAQGTTPDCNTNAVPDSCDIASTFSADIDENNIPDECQPDCNANDLPDSYEIAQGTTPDCNTNAVPDSCDIASGFAQDCNANTIPDSCDIATGLAKDCNLNGIPDSCDIASGMPDTDVDGRLDICETDFGDIDLNGIINGLDLSYILSGWGIVNPPLGDLDHNGSIGGGDLTAILARWGIVP